MLVIRIVVKIVGVFLHIFNWSEFQKLQVNSIKFNYSFCIQVQVYIHNWIYRVQRKVFNLSLARWSSANQTCKKQLRRDTKYLATAKQKGDQCAQFGYRRSNNYRSTFCPCKASRERQRRALLLFLSRRSCTRERLIPLLFIFTKEQHFFSDILEKICLK